MVLFCTSRLATMFVLVDIYYYYSLQNNVKITLKNTLLSSFIKLCHNTAPKLLKTPTHFAHRIRSIHSIHSHSPNEIPLTNTFTPTHSDTTRPSDRAIDLFSIFHGDYDYLHTRGSSEIPHTHVTPRRARRSRAETNKLPALLFVAPVAVVHCDNGLGRVCVCVRACARRYYVLTVACRLRWSAAPASQTGAAAAAACILYGFAIFPSDE